MINSITGTWPLTGCLEAAACVDARLLLGFTDRVVHTPAPLIPSVMIAERGLYLASICQSSSEQSVQMVIWPHLRFQVVLMRKAIQFLNVVDIRLGLSRTPLGNKPR